MARMVSPFRRGWLGAEWPGDGQKAKTAAMGGWGAKAVSGRLPLRRQQPGPDCNRAWASDVRGGEARRRMVRFWEVQCDIF